MAEEVTTDSKKSYGQILKTTAVFGSVKIFSVLIGLFKAKIIAIFLGPAGMGIFNLINYPVTLFSQFSGLGISTSGIREVAQTQDEKQLSETAEVIKYWNRTLGIIGSLILFALAPWVSKLSFGDDSYTWAFQVLSVVVFLTNLGSEYEVLLRGRRETKLVAKAGFYSSLAGFIASIPFYYAFGTAGIVVVILITALTLAGVNYIYARKLNIQPTKLPYREIFKRGQNMASIGFFIVLGDLIFVGITSIVNIYIRRTGSLDDVGYFQSCIQITQSSINLVLLTMAADYYPRLSQLQGNSKLTSMVATQQSEIAILLCTPVICSLILFSSLVIKVLLTSEFVIVQRALCYFLLGAIFRIPSWAMNYIVLANGKTNIYVIMVLLNNLLMLPLYIVGYHFYGVEGIGIAYIITTIFNVGLYTSVGRIIFKVKLSMQLWKLFFCGCIASSITIYISELADETYRTIISVFYAIFIIACSMYMLEKKTGLCSSLKSKLLKF